MSRRAASLDDDVQDDLVAEIRRVVSRINDSACGFDLPLAEALVAEIAAS